MEAAADYVDLRTSLASLGYLQPWRPLPAVPSGKPAAEQGRLLARQAGDRVAEAGRSVTEADLPALVEDVFGTDVAVIELDDGFDGLAAASDDAKLIVLATSQMPLRQRYTLAHELGHLLAGDDQDIHLDKDVNDKSARAEPSEVRANAFAADFLMPEGVLRVAVGATGLTQAAFASLACDLKVSPSALAFQLKRLDLIDAGTCDRFKAISAAKAAKIVGLGGDYARWIAQATRIRPPGLLVRDAYVAYESGATTLRPYANLLDRDVDELRHELESEDGVHDAR